MDPIQTSRRLSYVLRHRPDSIGLTLGPDGGAAVDDLLAALAAHGTPLTRAELAQIVADNDKRRFTLADGRIRANQGHSIPVELGLPPLAPPDRLYHGTAERHLSAIDRAGLLRGARHHVHLSPDPSTARTVGARHGHPVVLAVAAGRMHADGYAFFRSANGVWLTDHVPPAYLDRSPTT